MGVNSLPKTVTRQRRGCDLNPGLSAPESSTLTTRLPSHPSSIGHIIWYRPRAMMSSGLEGNRGFVVALATRHRLRWIIHLRAHGLRNTEMIEHPGYNTTLPYLVVCRLRNGWRSRAES